MDKKNPAIQTNQDTFIKNQGYASFADLQNKVLSQWTEAERKQFKKVVDAVHASSSKGLGVALHSALIYSTLGAQGTAAGISSLSSSQFILLTTFTVNYSTRFVVYFVLLYTSKNFLVNKVAPSGELIQVMGKTAKLIAKVNMPR